MSRKSQTDIESLKNMKDSEIDFSDIPKLKKGFFKNAKLIEPRGKERITMRLDADILEWFKALGTGYQTRINTVLRTYVNEVRSSPRRTRVSS